MILVAIGANLPLGSKTMPLATCEAAVREICSLPGVSLQKQSPWYRSQAIPVSDQPDYCNGVISLKTDMSPLALLAALQVIEAGFGRVRSVPNAARTLDLDIIDIDGTLCNEPTLVLPHPRAHERAFVLRPLQDIEPTWEHPVLHQSVSLLLAALPPQAITPWHDMLVLIEG